MLRHLCILPIHKKAYVKLFVLFLCVDVVHLFPLIILIHQIQIFGWCFLAATAAAADIQLRFSWTMWKIDRYCAINQRLSILFHYDVNGPELFWMAISFWIHVSNGCSFFIFSVFCSFSLHSILFPFNKFFITNVYVWLYCAKSRIGSFSCSFNTNISLK